MCIIQYRKRQYPMQNVKDSVFICKILLCFLLCFPTSKLGKYFAAFLRILSIF
jgi:hypothetical protein